MLPFGSGLLYVYLKMQDNTFKIYGRREHARGVNLSAAGSLAFSTLATAIYWVS
jgi:hypothetical protein